MTTDCVLHTQGYDHDARVWRQGSLIFVQTDYHEEIKDALKSFDRARWYREERAWAFPATPRNVWALQAMGDGPPFARYLEPVPERPAERRYNTRLKKKVKQFAKQTEMIAWALTKKQCIIAAEMRTGKTWAYITIIEELRRRGLTEIWFVAPKKVLAELRKQFAEWGFDTGGLRLVTYSMLQKTVERTKDADLPQAVVYDEGSFLKGHSKRSLAAVDLAIRMDRRHGEENCYRILGTGTPQPHSFLDWWMLCEVVRPGYLPWGNKFHFQQFLEVREKMQGVYGNEFWKRVQWQDGAPCVKCLGEGSMMSGLVKCEWCKATGSTEDHVTRLKSILSYMALIVYKHEVVELPKKEFVCFVPKMPDNPEPGITYYVDETLRPTASMANVAESLAKSALTPIEKMSKFGQLADGFQYQWKKENRPCPKKCKGEKPKCPECAGSGVVVIKTALPTIRGTTPKDNKVTELLAMHEEVGRFVIYAAYTEAIDHLCQLAQDEGWKVLRCDGKAGWKTWDGRSPEEALSAFADREYDEKVVAIGHPKSMGYGLDLAASPGFLFYSLNFDGETYMQAVERGHSINMDKKLGCTIYFIQVLPYDELARSNLQNKKGVQDITTADILRCMREYREGQA